MIRADRELLAEMARVNSDMVPLAMRIMEQRATTEEQIAFAERLATLAQQLQVRATGVVIDGDVARS